MEGLLETTDRVLFLETLWHSNMDLLSLLPTWMGFSSEILMYKL